MLKPNVSKKKILFLQLRFDTKDRGLGIGTYFERSSIAKEKVLFIKGSINLMIMACIQICILLRFLQELNEMALTFL